MKVIKTGVVLTVFRILILIIVFVVIAKFSGPLKWPQIRLYIMQSVVMVVQILVVISLLFIKKHQYIEWSINIWLVLQYASINPVSETPYPLYSYLFK